MRIKEHGAELRSQLPLASWSAEMTYSVSFKWLGHSVQWTLSREIGTGIEVVAGGVVRRAPDGLRGWSDEGLHEAHAALEPVFGYDRSSAILDRCLPDIDTVRR